MIRREGLFGKKYNNLAIGAEQDGLSFLLLLSYLLFLKYHFKPPALCFLLLNFIVTLPIFLFQCSSGRSWSVISSRAPKFVLVVKNKFPPWRFSSLHIWNGVVFLCACICSCVLGCGLWCMCAYGGVDEGMFMHVCACMFLQEILNCLLLSQHNLTSHGYKVASTLSDTL